MSSNIIESRIVSMVFDNKQFEKNVATSQKTIEDLNKSLEFKDADKNFKNLEDSSSRVTFSTMRTSIEDIGVKLKASTVIGIELLKNLTTSAINFAKTWASKVIDPITTGGWNRATAIDQAKFKLEGLGITWDEISSDIDYGVKDTAYSLASAATAAAQFAASNVALGDDMKTALRGISGVAAMTSTSYDEIAHIFTGIAGTNRVFADDLNSLATRGLNAKAVLADFLHTTEANVTEMVSKGEIDFATFAKAMDDAFGAHAKKGNETFEGSLDNMKAALGRIGAEFATSFRANMIPVWNALRVTINDVKAQMGPVFEVADAIMTDLSERISRFISHIDEIVVKGGAFAAIFEGVADLAEGAYEILITIADTVAEVFDTFSTYLPDIEWAHEVMVDFMDPEMIKDSVVAWKQGNFKEIFQPFADAAKKFKEFVQSEEFIEKLIDGTKKVLDIFDTIYTIVVRIVTNVKSLIDAFKVGFVWNSSYALRDLFSINGVLGLIQNVLHKIDDFISSASFIAFWNRTAAVFNTLGRFVSNLLSRIKSISSAFSDAWEKIFPIKKGALFGDVFSGAGRKILDSLREAISGLFAFSEGIYESQTKMFEKLFNVIKTGKKIFGVIGQVIGILVTNVINLANAFKKAFYEVFDGSSVSDFAARLNRLIVLFQAFVQKLLFSETAIDNFKRTFAGILAVVSIVKDVFTMAFSVISRVLGNVFRDLTRHTGSVIDGLTGFTAKIGDALVKVKEWLDEHHAFEKAGDVIYMVIQKTINFFKNLVDWIKKAWVAFNDWIETTTGSSLKEHFENIGETVSNVWEKIKDFFHNLAHGKEVEEGEEKVNHFAKIWESLKNMFSKVVEWIQAAWPTISTIFTSILDFVGSLFSSLTGLFGNFNAGEAGDTMMGLGALMGGIGAMQFGGFAKSGKGLLSGFASAFSEVTNTLKQAQEVLKAEVIKSIATSIVMIAAAIFALALLDPGNVIIATGAMETVMFTLKQLCIELYAVADTMGKSGLKEFQKLATGLTILAAALVVMSFAIKKLGSMDEMDLLKGLGAVGAMLFELKLALDGFGSGKHKNIVKTSAAILILAAALTLLVIPMKAFGKMEWEAIEKGLMATEGLLLAFAKATKKMSKDATGTAAAAASVLLLAIAMDLLIAPMKVFGDMEWDAIGRGLAAIGVILAEFVIAVRALQGGQALMAAGTVLMLATAMVMMCIPMKVFSTLDWSGIAKGLVAVGGLLLEFVIFTRLLKGGAALGAAATIIALAVALNLMIVPLEAFGHMSWQEIGKGLLVLAASLGILVVAGYLAAPIIGVILGLGAAIALLGIGALAIATSLLVAATALTILVALGPAAGDAIKMAFATILTLIPSLITAILEAIESLVTGIFGIIDTVIEGILTVLPKLLEIFPAVLDAFFEFVTTFLAKAAEAAPSIFESIGVILREFLRMLNDTLPEVFKVLTTLVKGIIQLIRDVAPDLIETVFEIILKLLEELAKNAADITELVLQTILSVLEVLTQKLPDITLKVVEFIISLINSIADTLMEKAPEIRDAIAKLLGSIIKLVLEIFGFDTSNMDSNEFTKIGSYLMGGFVGGIVDKFPEFWQKIKEFFKKIGDWFKTKFEDFKDFGRRILEGLRDGVKEKFEAVKEKITGFFEKIGTAVKKLFGIESPSKMFKEFGRQIMFGFRNGADDEHTGVMDKVKGFFGKIGQGVKDLFGIDKEDGMFTGIGKKIMSAFKNAVSDSSGDTESEVTGVFSKVTESAAGAEEQFSSVGQRLIAGLNKGMASVAETSVNTFDEILNMTKNSADGYYGEFYKIGVQLVNGLSNGIKANKPIANRSSADMANELATIARQTLGINSPSKVFAEIGMGCDEGMAKGIKEYSDLVTVAGVDVADTAVDTVSQAIAMVGNMVEDVSGDPVIRPVLDLTEIENGTQRIANMFDDPTYSAMNPFFMGGYIDQAVAPIKMGTGSGVNTTSNTTNNTAAININVNAARGQNAEEIADAVQKRLKLSLDQRGYAFR